MAKYLDDERFEEADEETPEQKVAADAEGVQAVMRITGCTENEAKEQLGLVKESTCRQSHAEN